MKIIHALEFVIEDLQLQHGVQLSLLERVHRVHVALELGFKIYDVLPNELANVPRSLYNLSRVHVVVAPHHGLHVTHVTASVDGTE